MNTKFSFYSLGLLLKRFFIENKQSELTFWAISTVVFMLMYNPTAISFFIFISGFIFASRMYKIFGYTPGGMHYLLIPATHLEKLVSGILLSTVYFLSAIMVTYLIGNAVGPQIGNLLFDYPNEIHYQLFDVSSQIQIDGVPQSNPLASLFISFIVVQSVFLLGSIYFRKNAVGKTILSIILLSVILGTYEVTLLKLFFDTASFHNHNISINNAEALDMLKNWRVVGEIIKYGFAPFLWVVSYFRLTEKEV